MPEDYGDGPVTRLAYQLLVAEGPKSRGARSATLLRMLRQNWKKGSNSSVAYDNFKVEVDGTEFTIGSTSGFTYESAEDNTSLSIYIETGDIIVREDIHSAQFLKGWDGPPHEIVVSLNKQGNLPEALVTRFTNRPLSEMVEFPGVVGEWLNWRLIEDVEHVTDTIILNLDCASWDQDFPAS